MSFIGFKDMILLIIQPHLSQTTSIEE